MPDPETPVSPDDETVIDETPRPVTPRTRRDPLDAAEKALARAAEARGVPLELPSRVPPDRSDVFAAAERALANARAAREQAATGSGGEAERRAQEQLDRLKAGRAAPSEDEGAPPRKKRDL